MLVLHTFYVYTHDMQPQSGQDYTAQQSKQKPRKNTNLVLVILLVVGLIIVGVTGYLLVDSINQKNARIISLNSELAVKDDELATAQLKIEELDNPLKKQRDKKRQSDISRFADEVQEFVSSNNGRFPTTEPTGFVNQFEDPYISKLSNFIDPNTKQAYTITPLATVQTPPGIVLGNIQYQWPGKCSGSELSDEATERQAAARILLESGDIYCLDIES
jgi:hypothetical protein